MLDVPLLSFTGKEASDQVDTSLPRRILERLSRGRVLNRRLPADLGACPIVVSPDATLQLWKRRLASDLFDFAREFVHPGCTIWDIGANVGLFTIAAAHRAGPAGRVVSVEADIWLAELLQRSADMQAVTSAPIQVIHVAVSNSIALKAFHIARRGRASNFLSDAPGRSQTGGIRHTRHVVSITLDWLLEKCPIPDVIKIDVEGAELDVLLGGLNTITQAKPVILCEVGYQQDEITELFLAHGYSLYDWDSHPREQVSHACFNTLALPGRLE